ncbi:Cytidylate kinase [Propionicimonas sp. T2.31MG-18]|uniref:cytidylate kinase-like family protein n=1 Tax=Propionicimonas sp. T2.31MG-18 TaxID=3157620 RepID=UPI0035E852E0
MAVITISRQLGSHGARIARALAKDLGYALVDKGTINRVIRQYGITRLDRIYDHKPKIWELFNEDSALTIQMMNETIAAFAAQGDVVILGRGGFRVLRGLSDVLNVFVKAPDAVRAKRIGKRDEIGVGEAAEIIRSDDELRSRFVSLFYGADWADESAFDLVVDTGELSDADAVARIAAEAAALPSYAEGPSAAGLEVDVVLRETVEQELARLAGKKA